MHRVTSIRKVENIFQGQLRYGIEHIFKSDMNPLKIIYNKMGFSFTTNFPENAAEQGVTKTYIEN